MLNVGRTQRRLIGVKGPTGSVTEAGSGTGIVRGGKLGMEAEWAQGME